MRGERSWTVESEPEVTEWAAALPTELFARLTFYVDLLESEGVLLGEPYTRQLRGKLRELRFHLDDAQWRISYYVGLDRRIVLLIVFRRTQRHESREVERAWRAMNHCADARHLDEEAR